jgi:hypothetical protein
MDMLSDLKETTEVFFLLSSGHAIDEKGTDDDRITTSADDDQAGL